MGRIFVSYRREDSADAAGRIFDRLQSRFGRSGLFMDVDSIPYGVDFRTRLDEALSESAVLLAVVGDGWLTASDDAGSPRLHDGDDYVRAEIETAMRRGITVIPVLVGSARMPPPEALPASMRELAFLNAAEVRSGGDFKDQVERLIDALIRAGATPEDAPPTPEAGRPGRRTRSVVVGVVCVVLLAALVWAVASPGGDAAEALLTLECVPKATVNVDGRPRGETPMSIYLPVGPHEIEFSRPGFSGVRERIALRGDDPRRQAGALVLEDVDAEQPLFELCTALGLDYQPFREPKRRRESADGWMTHLIWPQGDVRKASLETLCVEVSEHLDFSTLVLGFRRGETWLHREAHAPISYAEVRAIPPQVLRSLEPGASVHWGLWERGDRLVKRALLRILDRGSEERTARREEALRQTPGFRVQSAIVRQAILVEFLLGEELFSEALDLARDMRRRWPDAALPDVMALKAAARIDLDRTLFEQKLKESYEGRGEGAYRPLGRR